MNNLLDGLIDAYTVPQVLKVLPDGSASFPGGSVQSSYFPDENSVMICVCFENDIFYFTYTNEWSVTVNGVEREAAEFLDIVIGGLRLLI